MGHTKQFGYIDSYTLKMKITQIELTFSLLELRQSQEEIHAPPIGVTFNFFFLLHYFLKMYKIFVFMKPVCHTCKQNGMKQR